MVGNPLLQADNIVHDVENGVVGLMGGTGLKKELKKFAENARVIWREWENIWHFHELLLRAKPGNVDKTEYPISSQYNPYSSIAVILQNYFQLHHQCMKDVIILR